MLQTQKFGYDLTRGGSYAEEWKGVVGSQMVAKWNGTVFLCRKATMEYKQDVATATFEWSADGSTGGGGALNSKAVTQDRWECPEPKSEKPLFSSPQFMSAIDGLLTYFGVTADLYSESLLLSAWNKSADSKIPFMQAIAATSSLGSWTAFATANPAEASFMVRCYNLVLNGQTHYQCSQYALRHTTTAPNGWSLNVSDLNTNCIYTTPQLLAEAESTYLWNFPLPGRLDYKLSLAAAAFTAMTPTRNNFQIGWLKSASAESSVGNQLIEIQTGYVLDQWSTDANNLAT